MSSGLAFSLLISALVHLLGWITLSVVQSNSLTRLWRLGKPARARRVSKVP
jgi:hypothetical protein